MSKQSHSNIIKVDLPKFQDEDPPSPTFGVKPNVPDKQILEGMQKVGKHGKSHHQYLKVAKTHQQQKNIRPITLEQLSKHTTKESAWLSLNGIIYDVTVYLNYHPGGEVLLQGCGKQCLPLFNQYHPWVNGKYLLQKYRIGFLR